MFRLTVYGFGSRGHNVIDQLLAQGRSIEMIFDKNPSAPDYRGIPVRSLDAAEARARARGSHCIVALHNSYVDIKEVYASLKAAHAMPISLVNAGSFGFPLQVEQGYWLDKSSPNFEISENDAEWMRNNLADATSVEVFNALKRYRETGDIADCPHPSVFDEYTPKDLPRYPEPVNLIDCGAFTGVAYRRFAREYSVRRYLAFEPDPKNFSRLRSSAFDCHDVTLLPLGVWNRTEVLRFRVGQDMGSNVDDSGEALIQCAAVDDVAQTFDATVVKFDVEGAEVQALLGMRQLITRCRPALCISVYHRPDHLVSVPKMLAAWGLACQFYLRVHEHNAFGTVLYVRPTLSV